MGRTWMIPMWATAGCFVLLACGPSTAVPEGGSGSSSSTTASQSSGDPSAATDDGSDTAPTNADSTTAALGETTTTGGSEGSAGSTGQPPPACLPDRCPWSDCQDGLDNDGDGLFDFDDPECISLCDDDESSTFHGHPSDADPCGVDCYFDANNGSGDDGCQYNLICDPLQPGAFAFCTGDPDSPACMAAMDQEPECLAGCIPMVPPGCDCFGCCTFATPSGPQDLLLGHPECTMADPSQCPPCTKHPQCRNDCDDPCEWCFGQDPPANCEQITCEYGEPCQEQCDCPPEHLCAGGCCRPVYPPPP